MTDLDLYPTQPAAAGRPGSTAPAATGRPDPSAAVRELRALLPGQVVAPGDDEFDRVRLGWVVNVDQRPAAVVTVLDEEDVVAVVTCARRHAMSVTAQPVGHGTTTALSDTILLRTAALQQVEVDVAGRRARVGAGVKWGTLLDVLEPTGLVALAGSNPDPSVVGFLLGGGLSWFSRAHGLAAHSVTAFELVDASGTLRRVSAAIDADLFWALCGGGGDFGIVTAVELRLYESGPVFGGRLLWHLEMAQPVLRAFVQVCRTAPDELTAWSHLLRFPDDPALPPHLRGRSFVTVDLTFLGSEADADRLLSPLRSLPAPLADSLGTVPLGQLGGIAAEPTDPMPGLERSALLTDLDADSLESLLAAVGADSDVPLAVVQLRHLGGALARGADSQGPAGSLDEQFQVFCLGVPVVPGMETAIEGAFTAVLSALAGQVSGRSTFNFLGSDTDPSRAFTADALDRLRRVKRSVDPDGVIRSNRPVLGLSA